VTSPARAAKTSPIALAVRLAWGALLLVVPGVVLGLIAARPTADASADRQPRRILRVLGARHLAQAAVEWRRGPTTRNIGTGIDVLHASTDIAFACLDARWRRAALTDALVTTGLVALDLTNL
jgi:hypothetical protein